MKGIIVVDIPECCDKCRFSSEAFDSDLFEEGECYCTLKSQSVDEIKEGYKPDWCPIKQIPEKMDTDACSAQSRCIATGYNHCIDKILKGAENGQEQTTDR